MRVFALIAGLCAAAAAFAVEPVLRQPEREMRLRHAIVHASGPLTPEDRRELALKGVLVQQALPNGRYLARVAEERSADARVVAVEPLTADSKIARSARREAGRGKTWAELNVYFHEDVSFDDARTALLAAGAAIDPLSLEFLTPRRIIAKIAPQSIEALAADDRVQAVTGPIRFKMKSDNAVTAALSHATELYSAPYGLSGAGVTVSFFELAPAQADHVEFGGRLTVLPQVSGGANSDKAHATHVAGTIGASGINSHAKGMAPQARIFQFCVAYPGNACKNNYFSDKDKELTKLGSGIDNNSWGYTLGWDESDFGWVWNAGDDYWGAYELELVSPIDAISLERAVLFVHSAGNDGSVPTLGDFGRHRHVDDDFELITDKQFCFSANGSGTDCPTTGANACSSCETVKHHPLTPYDTIGMTASAKNSIAVGAVQIVGPDTTIANFSSRGPAKDGRVKPDIVARGVGVESTVPTNNYASKNGTSMSTPAVTGMAALLVEQWRKTFGVDPNPVQLKAVILAGADDLGNPGPDYTYGYGLVNAKKSADLIINDGAVGRRIRSVTVGNGEAVEIPLVVDSTQNLRVLMQWGDPAIPLAGSFVAEKALVNDLDMEIVGPTGTVHLPYVLDKANHTANATTGVNVVDNTEQIEIKNATPGVYRVQVNGTRVPQGPQRAVVVSSVRAAAPCVDLTESSNNVAYGPLTTGQTVSAGICGAGDTDTFRLTAMPGTVDVTFTTGDTAISVVVGSTTRVIPANRTVTVSTVVGAGPATVTISVSASGPLGVEPFYRFTPQFTPESGTRRRSVR
jgi:hypothetical protein